LKPIGRGVHKLLMRHGVHAIFGKEFRAWRDDLADRRRRPEAWCDERKEHREKLLSDPLPGDEQAAAPRESRDTFRFFDPIVGEGAAIYHTAWARGEGERVWILAKLPEITVAADDVRHKYLLVSNIHDGSSAVQMRFTPVAWCATAR
jgi:hypothetical protein